MYGDCYEGYCNCDPCSETKADIVREYEDELDLWRERLGANLTAAGLAAALVNKINETSPGWPERHRMVLAFRLGIAEAGAP